jgi:hypothetical protein
MTAIFRLKKNKSKNGKPSEFVYLSKKKKSPIIISGYKNDPKKICVYKN